MRRSSCRGRPRVSSRFKGSTNGATTLHCSLVKNMEAGVRANDLCLYSTTFNLRLVLVVFLVLLLLDAFKAHRMGRHSLLFTVWVLMDKVKPIDAVCIANKGYYERCCQ